MRGETLSKKKISVIVIVAIVVLAVLGYYMYSKYESTTASNSGTATPVVTLSTIPVQTQTRIVATSTIGSKETSTTSSALPSEPNFNNELPLTLYSPSGIKISLGNFVGVGSNGAFSADVYVGQKFAGSITGSNLLESSFSPDSKYLAMLMESPNDSGVPTYSIYIVNVADPSNGTIKVGPPQSNPALRIGSFTWNIDSLQIVVYLSNSSNQAWLYSPESGSYNLIKTSQ